jgi:hypothetical protein
LDARTNEEFTLEVKNNPAGRLHDLLQLAQKQPPKEPARKAWAQVFGVAPEDTGLLLRMLADLINLMSETKASIERLDDVDHRIYLKPFAKIERFFSQVNLDAGWEHWRAQLDEPTLYGLQFAADRLSRINGSTAIAQEDIQSIQSELEQFVESVLASDLPQGLKALFLRNLESIRRALLVYRIRGVEGLEHELERAVGSLMLNQSEIPPAGSKSQSRKFWERFFVVIDRINKAVTLTRGAKELAGPAVQAISHLLDKSS